ncbi:MAG: ABC transporter substrate-binding protein [Maribacter sp.]|nr:ABC transporter substrate-binding protein [Maribacter sp.]
MNRHISLLILVVFFSCKEKEKTLVPVTQKEEIPISYAQGFSMEKMASGLTVIKLTSPWPNSETSFTYALIPKEILPKIALNKSDYDAVVETPVERIIVTSTTHIPALEALGVLDRLVGFPNTALISSTKARAKIDKGLIKELGNNEVINTEVVLELNPNVVVGFGINNQNKAYGTIQRSSIPVVYNGEWTEKTPLGKAEWIKFFAPFFQKEAMSDSIFRTIEDNYKKAKALALDAKDKPTVLTGGLYKDVWHVAGGKSWMAQFLKDAQSRYLWANNEDIGGAALSLESVLDKGNNADFWLNPSMLTSYDDMQHTNRHYQQFDAFKNRKIFSNTITQGETGGLLYYELAPNRPDLVLKDLIHIFHPELLPDHELFFFKPLN